MNCELCEREVNRLTVHHLIPKQKAKNQKAETIPTANICSACHRQIHSLFDNTQLSQEFNSLEKLKSQPQMQKFLSWVKKQDPSRHVRVYRGGK